MAYIPDNLVTNEELLYHSRFHWWMWAQNCLPLGLVLVVLAAILTFIAGAKVGAIAFGATLVATLAFGALPYMRWRFAEVGVTTRRVIIKRGVVVRDLFEMPIDEIENSQVSETVLGRLLGYNRITLEDVDGPKKHLNLIKDGHDFHGRVLEQISMGRTWREQYYTPQPPRTQYNPAPPPDEGRKRSSTTPVKAQSTPLPARTSTPPKPTMNAIPLQMPSPAPTVKPPTQQLNQAIALLQQNKKSQARDVLKALLEQDERNADAWYLMGLTIVEPTRRRAAFMKALRINPQHAQARQALSQIPSA